MKRLLVAAGALSLGAGCASSDAVTGGTYSLRFPSTAAAVAVDLVQVYTFPVGAADDRANLCQSLIQKRKNHDPLTSATSNSAPNICELDAGRKTLTLPFGESAILAVGQRLGDDLLIGCAIQTVGAGDLPITIDLALVDVSQPVPDTNCSSIADYCAQKCQ